jgi:hypothetical protein
VPWGRLSVQSAPHEMPAGDEVTVPVPEPVLVTVNPYTLMLNVAVTVVAAVTVTAHVPTPEQPPPDQPAKFEPPAAVAVSVRLVAAVDGLGAVGAAVDAGRRRGHGARRRCRSW